jgi:hypothetical protein
VERLPIRLELGRLRGLSPPLRYLAYVAGALLVWLVAAGVGVTAGVVVFGGPPEWLTSGSGDTEGTMSAKTGEAGMSKGAALETPGDAKYANCGEAATPSDAQYANSDEAATPSDAQYANSGEANPDQNSNANNTVFTHTATDANSRDYYTYISDPAIDGDPNAVVLVAESTDRRNDGDATYDHNIGVWYEGVNEKKWAIFNQDRAAIPAGATFEVIIPPASETFVHYAKLDNTEGNSTYLDSPLTNREQDAVLTVTQNWNPGGGRGVYNDHPISVLYDADMRKWAICNRGGAPMPDGAAFNIAVSRVPNS